MLRLASKEYGYDIDPGEVAKIWRAGCIIRASLLGDIRQRLRARSRTSSTCCSTMPSATRSAERQDGWRHVVQAAVGLGIPVPAMGSSLAYYDCVPQRAPAGEPDPGAARLLRRAHLPPRRSRRRVPHASGPATAPPDRERYTLMTTDRPLKIPPEGALDFLSLGALIHRLDPGVIPFRKAHDLRDPRQRRRVQHRRQPGRLLRAAAPASPRAMVEYPIGELIAERVRAMGVTPFYKIFKHDGVARAEHGDRLQRSRLRRARPDGLLQPLQRGRRAAQARRFRLGRRSSAPACAGSTAAASSRRSPRPPRS